jgi:predicted porin
MNKKLVALAVAGVLAAPLAQAQTANVTLYGRVNIDAEVLINAKQNDPPPGNIKQNLYRVSPNSSRLGVRGTESLGGGLNVIFQVEERYDPTNSGPATVSGDTFIGLQGGWGTTKVGYFLSPYDDLTAIWSSVPTLGTSIFNAANIWANNGGQGINSGSFDDRIGNSIRYDTPTIQGFTGSFQLGGRDPGQNDNSGVQFLSNSGDLAQMRRHAYVVSAGGFYNNGPIQAGVVYEQHNNIRLGTAANPKLTDKGLSAGFSYNFGVVKLGLAYEELKYDVPAGGEVKRDFWALSGIFNLGPGQLYAMYGKGNDGKGSAADGSRVGAVTKGSDTGAQTWSVTYTYPLSKRTLLYGGYIMIDNDKNANYNFGNNSIPGLCGGNGAACGDAAKPQGLGMGMVHFF